MKINDNRTDDEKFEYDVLIGGVDEYLSGWGEAKGGLSYALWACRSEDVDKVFAWVANRSDIKKTRVYAGIPQGGKHDHCSIYVVRPGHPALS